MGERDSTKEPASNKVSEVEYTLYIVLLHSICIMYIAQYIVYN